MPIVSYQPSAESSLITQVVGECKHETKSDCSQEFGHGRCTWAEDNSGGSCPEQINPEAKKGNLGIEYVRIYLR